MSLDNGYIELDNFVPVEFQDKLEKLLTHPSFPWALTVDSVYGSNGKLESYGAVGFFHNLLYNGQKRSGDLGTILPLVEYFEKAANIKTKNMFRIRVGLFTKHPDSTPHGPHTDATFPHWTGVYYVNDCDGDFVLYNETYEDYSEKEVSPELLTVKKVCSPSRGKMVLFDGRHYHASSFPTKTPLRLAITFNFELE